MAYAQPGRLAEAFAVGGEVATTRRFVRFRHRQFTLQQSAHRLVTLVFCADFQAKHSGALAEQFAYHQGAGSLELRFGQ
ncbi:hypothetical protein D3C77_567610 [compost metagenome]